MVNEHVQTSDWSTQPVNTVSNIYRQLYNDNICKCVLVKFKRYYWIILYLLTQQI